MSHALPRYLRAIRTVRALSIRGAALRTGVSYSAISRWESGAYEPDIPELDIYLRKLGATGDRTRILALMDRRRAVLAVERALTLDGEPTHIPATGDLLRAMRLRCGVALAEAAGAAGVTVGAVSHWEHSLRGVPPVAAQALCDLYLASPRERAAIARGCRTLARPARIAPGALDALAAEVDAMRALIWADSDEVDDLACLSALATIGAAGGGKPSCRATLAVCHCIYGMWLSRAGRWRESGEQSGAALDLLHDCRSAGWVWVQAAADHARARNQTADPTKWPRGAAILREYITMTEAPGNLTTLYRDIVEHLCVAGWGAEALGYAKLAQVTAERCEEPVAQELARWAMGRALIESGRPAEGLSHLEGGPDEPLMHVLRGILRVEALMALGERAEADLTLREVSEVVESHHFPHMVPVIADLAARL